MLVKNNRLLFHLFQRGVLAFILMPAGNICVANDLAGLDDVTMQVIGPEEIPADVIQNIHLPGIEQTPIMSRGTITPAIQPNMPDVTNQVILGIEPLVIDPILVDPAFPYDPGLNDPNLDDPGLQGPPHTVVMPIDVEPIAIPAPPDPTDPPDPIIINPDGSIR